LQLFCRRKGKHDISRVIGALPTCTVKLRPQSQL
jgi:hypothetical protein